jgi:hypothetical protein
MYVYESIIDRIWRRPSDIVFYEITVRHPNTWDEQVYDLLIEEILVNQISGQVHFQVTEDLEDA